jgi:hypothetical protein
LIARAFLYMFTLAQVDGFCKFRIADRLNSAKRGPSSLAGSNCKALSAIGKHILPHAFQMLANIKLRGFLIAGRNGFINQTVFVHI